MKLRATLKPVLGEVLEVCIHTLLHVCHVYPRDLFNHTRYLGIRCYGCRHPDVLSYIAEFLVVASPAICCGEANGICLVLMDWFTEEVYERFVFDLNIESLVEKTTPDYEAQCVRDLEWAFRQLMLKIITLEGRFSNMNKKVPDSLTFKLCLRIKDGQFLRNVSNNVDQPNCSEELVDALRQGNFFQPDQSSCILDQSPSEVLSRPIKTVNVDSCRFNMTLFMEVKKT